MLGLVITFLRRSIPGSPRWLVTHGRSAEADATVAEIEKRVEAEGRTLTPVPDDYALPVKAHESAPFRQLLLVKSGTSLCCLPHSERDLPARGS